MKKDQLTHQAESLMQKATALADEAFMLAQTLTSSNEKPTLDPSSFYTLGELLSGDIVLSIPDMQRDYCWGNAPESGESIAKSFVVSLCELFGRYGMSSSGDVPLLGLIYGYEEQPGNAQICLSDGQQRLTTLFLLLGWLNRVTGGELFKDKLTLSDGETPRLQYEVRESSHYFIAALTKHYFLQAGNKGEIPQMAICGDKNTLSADWYFADYIDDPTAQSCIATLTSLQATLKDWVKEELETFGEFICERLRLMYIDMGDREHGEEAFTVINTTGEPLDTSENLKPRMIYESVRRLPENATKENKENVREEVSHCWEAMETWCWQQKGKLWEEDDTFDTAKPFVREVLRWTAILHAQNKETCINALSPDELSFPVEDVPFNEVWNTYCAFRFLYEMKQNLLFLSETKEGKKQIFLHVSPLSKDHSRLLYIECFRLLPIIAYLTEQAWFPEIAESAKEEEGWFALHEEADLNLLRFVRFIDNLSQTNRIGDDPTEYVYAALQAAKVCRPDVLDLLKSDDKEVQKLINGEEQLKLEILQKVGEQGRAATEEAFWALQDIDTVPSHQIWAGEIATVINWSGGKEAFDVSRFRTYTAKLDELLINRCKEEVDLLRRALLTRGLKRYPLRKQTLGWMWENWTEIVAANPEKFQALLDELPVAAALDDPQTGKKEWASSVREVLEKMCENDASIPELTPLVKYPNLLAYCTEKRVQYIENNEDWELRRSKRTAPIRLRSLALYHALADIPRDTPIRVGDHSTKYPNHPDWCIYLWAETNEPGGVTIKNASRHMQFVIITNVDGCTIYLERTDDVPVWEWPDEDAIGMRWGDGCYEKDVTFDYAKDDPYAAVRDQINRVIRWIDSCEMA